MRVFCRARALVVLGKLRFVAPFGGTTQGTRRASVARRSRPVRRRAGTSRCTCPFASACTSPSTTQSPLCSRRPRSRRFACAGRRGVLGVRFGGCDANRGVGSRGQGLLCRSVVPLPKSQPSAAGTDRGAATTHTRTLEPVSPPDAAECAAWRACVDSFAVGHNHVLKCSLLLRLKLHRRAGCVVRQGFVANIPLRHM